MLVVPVKLTCPGFMMSWNLFAVAFVIKELLRYMPCNVTSLHTEGGVNVISVLPTPSRSSESLLAFLVLDKSWDIWTVGKSVSGSEPVWLTITRAVKHR